MLNPPQMNEVSRVRMRLPERKKTRQNNEMRDAEKRKP
jgi:hypothetical protein